MIIRIMVFFLVLGGLQVSTPAHAEKNISVDDYSQYVSAIDISCQIDADCTVKDVHNCCGYNPVCVNVKAEVDAQRVEAYCRDNGVASVCGFIQITGCHCEHNTCSPVTSGGPVSGGPLLIQ